MIELFSLGEIWVSDFLRDGEQPRGGKHELKLVMEEDTRAVRLETVAPLNQLFGEYWYRSGLNEVMSKELKGIVDSILPLMKFKENDVWCDAACFPQGNIINTRDGGKDIKDVTLKDYVLGHDGRYHKVKKLFTRKHIGEFIKLKLRGLNSDSLVTKNHLILTKRGWVEAGKIKNDDFICLRSGFEIRDDSKLDLFELIKKCHPHEVKLIGGYVVSISNGLKTKLPRFIEINDDFAKVLGYYVGNGSGGGGTNVNIVFNKKYNEKIEHIVLYFKKTFGITCEVRPDQNVVAIRANSRLLSSVFKYLCGHTAKNKKIPFAALNNSVIHSFIDALWFTDGHVTNHVNRHGKSKENFVYSTVSRNLIIDLWNVVGSVGIKSSVQCVKNNRGFSLKDGRLFRLTIERNDSIPVFKSLLKGKWCYKSVERLVPVIEITRVKESYDVYNFEVETVNSYVCNGVTVHNCNDGTLLSFIPKQFIRIGVDPADDSFKEQSERHSDLIIQDYFSAAAFKQSKFGKQKISILTSIAVFYDIDRPDDFCKDVYEILDDEGLWIMQLSHGGLMLKQLAFDSILSEHVYYYTLSSLSRILERNGFVVVDCSLNETNGGSFRVYIRKKISNEKLFATQPYRDVCEYRIQSLLQYEDYLKLDEPHHWKYFFFKINELKEKVISFVKTEKEKGKTFWAYSASTKGNTALQWFGLTDKEIDGIAERNIDKWGLKTVGSNIKIYSEDDFRKASPDYCIILAWHFVQAFKEREREYLANGGKFIVTMPKFEIIEK